ncbi:hypothetical protein GWK73_01480 [Candidatus Saccharibacteria bacterium oral taxon 955]|nr:hypothetical protein GWK73_01480 [Candidatus Saccharibacteria bacterium oral taxon 955]
MKENNIDKHAYRVESLVEDYGVGVVSSIRSYGYLGPFRPRPGVDFRGVRLFDILLRRNQILCSSTVSPGDTERNLYGKWGVVIGSGDIEKAFPYDATTTVVDGEVTSIFSDRIKNISRDEQIASALSERALYNELNVHADSLAGVYYCVDSFEDAGSPSPTELPSEKTKSFIEELNIPVFMIRNGIFHAMKTPFDLSTASEVVDVRDIPKEGIRLSENDTEALKSYLTDNLVLAPRNAVSSGMSRGSFAYHYRRTRDSRDKFDDFLAEQVEIIDQNQRSSLRLYGAIALYSFALESSISDPEASNRAQMLAEAVMSRDQFNELRDRVEESGHLAIARSDLDHYLLTGNLPDHLSDH